MIHPLGALLHQVLGKARVGSQIADAGVGDGDRRGAEIGSPGRGAVRGRQRRVEIHHVERIAEACLVHRVRTEIADERRDQRIGASLGVAPPVVRVQRADALPFLPVPIEVVARVESVAVVEAMIQLEETLPLPLRRRKRPRRQHRRHHDRVVDVGILVVRKVMRHVFPDRTADGAAKLPPLLRRLRTGEQVGGNPFGGPPEPVGAACERVRTALGDDTDRAGAGLAGLGLEAVRDDLQFLHDVERQAVAAAELAVQRADLTAGHRHAVSDEVGHPDALSVHRQRAASGTGRNDAAGGLQERQEIASVRRKRIHLSRVENRGELAFARADERRFCLNRDGLLQAADFQLEIDFRLRVGEELEAFAVLGREALKFGAERPFTGRRDRVERVAALAVRDR